MVESRGDLHFGKKALGAERRGEIRAQDLDRDIAVMLEVVREIDRRHAASPKLAFDGVAVGQGCLERVDAHADL
ncbi:MAG TPA: hypothetical protein VGL65_07125 [Gemmatimonadales bacterium]|jgi:hypothetical protein